MKLWTSGTGLLRANVVLEALAAIEAGETSATAPPKYPLIWLKTPSVSAPFLVVVGGYCGQRYHLLSQNH